MVNMSDSQRQSAPDRVIRRRMAAGLIFVNLFVAALAVSSLRHGWRQFHERAELSTGNLTRLLDGEFSSDIEKIDGALLALGQEALRNVGHDGAIKKEFRNFMQRQQARLPEVTGLRLVDDAGRLILAADGAGASGVSSPDSCVHRLEKAAGDLLIGGLAPTADGRRRIVSLSRRVEDREGRFVAIVCADLSVEHLVSSFKALELGPGAAASMRDSEWRIVARYPMMTAKEGVTGAPVMSPPVRELMAAGQMAGTYRVKSVLDGTERTYSFRRIGPYPLYVTVGVATQDYLAEWKENLVKLVAWQFLFLLFTLAASRLVLILWRSQRVALNSLHTSEERFRYALESAPIGMAVVSLGGELLQVNQALCRIVDRERQDLKRQNLKDLIHPMDLGNAVANMERLIAGETDSCQQELRYVSADGRLVWMQLTESIVRDAAGTPLHFVVQIEDISGRRHAAEQLALSAKVFEDSGECIVITDDGERILSVNKAFTRATGYEAEEVLGKTPRVMASGRQDAEFYRKLWRTVQESGYWAGEVWDKRKNGEIYPKWLSISAVRNAANRITNYIGIFSDITERKKVEAHIEFLAYHDALTELPNRLLARDHLELAIAYSGRSGHKTAVLFLDLDNFKTINDSLGHPVGDALLKAVAKRLCDCTRDTDTVSRQGGDEFLIILADMPDTDAIATAAEKVLASLAATFHIDGHEIATSLSIGVAVFPDDGRDIDTLLKLADTAMYHAKEAGRNAYRFYAEHMNAHAIERQRIHVGLLRSLERNELVLHYQPQIDLVSGRVIGAEALIRWNSPEHGLLPPGAFIPVAEESGLIVPIGDWVLREACRQSMVWRAAGLTDLVMAVNVSAIQFKRGDLERSVLGALEDSGLPPQFLELELTESILIQDTDKVLDTVGRLKAHGLMMSIDDFGTGYSSLSYLKRFNVDKLKIDRSFVSDMIRNPHDATIVRAIIQLARSFNLRTIAEGVEDEHLVSFLRLQYCDEAQGFHFARPMPADQFLRYVLDTQVSAS